ncbi:MAG: hypothetical protein ACR2NP_15770 [Pirellulaceae bacterium]
MSISFVLDALASGQRATREAMCVVGGLGEWAIMQKNAVFRQWKID